QTTFYHSLCHHLPIYTKTQPNPQKLPNWSLKTSNSTKMQVRDSIEKTKIFFQETLIDLKSLFHQNIPKPTTLITNPLSYWRSNCKNPDHTIADHEYYTTFCNELESDFQKVAKLNTTAPVTSVVGSWERLPRARAKPPSRTRTTNHLVGPVSHSVDPSPTTTTTATKVPAVLPKETAPNRELAHDQMKNIIVKRKKNKNPTKNHRSTSTGSNEVSYYMLARKLKELEMMDVSDVEHVLDVEEALHYYSRLKSTAYLDIVDKFFSDMYHEISMIIPPPNYCSQASASANSSRRRLSSFRL
ncbi:hypothetical protein LINGRAHAP2_LOCUS12369, partial [Linum grandiflorum]